MGGAVARYLCIVYTVSCICHAKIHFNSNIIILRITETYHSIFTFYSIISWWVKLQTLPFLVAVLLFAAMSLAHLMPLLVAVVYGHLLFYYPCERGFRSTCIVVSSQHHRLTFTSVSGLSTGKKKTATDIDIEYVICICNHFCCSFFRGGCDIAKTTTIATLARVSPEVMRKQ